jgi:hypothetical protein
MPGTQPRGTHAFDPGSSSSQSATQMLTAIISEEDGAEDQVGPPLDSPMADLPAALDYSDYASPLITDLAHHLGAFSLSSLGGGGSVILSSPPSPLPDPRTSSAGSTKPPPSSSRPPKIQPIPYDPTQQHDRDISMGLGHSRSAHSITTNSVSVSDPASGSNQCRKRKHDARSMSGIWPPSSK